MCMVKLHFQDLLRYHPARNSCHYFEQAWDQQKADNYTQLECGFTTIPLLSINIPFHPGFLYWTALWKNTVIHILKAFNQNSSWNWVHQDTLIIFYGIIFSWLVTVDREITAHCVSFLNCAEPELLICRITTSHDLNIMFYNWISASWMGLEFGNNLPNGMLLDGPWDISWIYD